ncbi:MULTISPECIES: hypothetical protein [Pseudomonas]|uniref:hypothetical protein n=1 Tax=Pseudomonas TaxID=286 RepID=UPI0021F8C0A8|nr:hypothetical protein [Pseudomonas putida]
MSEIKMLLEIVGGSLNVRHSIEKRDSEELSKFQAIRLLYRMLDYIGHLNLGLEYSALAVAREVFGGEGWADEVIELLLAAETWESRTSAAWHAVDDEARKTALSLDFRQPEWRARVKFESVLSAFKNTQTVPVGSLH